MLWRLVEPLLRIQKESENGDLNHDFQQSHQIAERKAASNSPTDRVRDVYVHYKVVALALQPGNVTGKFRFA